MENKLLRYIYIKDLHLYLSRQNFFSTQRNLKFRRIGINEIHQPSKLCFGIEDLFIFYLKIQLF
jgi:hypothetical protein